MLNAEQMHSLPESFATIPDPRRPQGKRHPLHVVLAIAAGAILCGMRGYKAIHDWALCLGKKARERFGCRMEKGHYVVPSEFVIRDCLTRIHPDALDKGINTWKKNGEKDDSALAIDGKTMKNAVDPDGNQTHIMSVIGHDSNHCYTQKKLERCL